MKQSFKALVLIALGIFLYSRLVKGTLLYYINGRFAWLTLLAAIGLLLVAAGYRQRPKHRHTHPEDGHSHVISWGGLLFVSLPVILGLLVPPRPLGASAIQSREVSVGSLSSALPPSSSHIILAGGEKDILDWLSDFQRVQDPAAFDGQEARVIGFVYRDDRFEADAFMVSRFVVSCCVADAAAVGLIVRWSDAGLLENDQWVEVSGHFEAGQFYGQPVPILVASEIMPTGVPNQPYLYYY